MKEKTIADKPAAFGIDIVLHSGTKYLNGHSDVVVGVLCGSKAMVKKIFESELMTLGGILSPHDAALVIRDNKLYGLCVVDDKGDLIGVLTIKDLIEALFHLSAVALRQESESPPA